MKIKVSKMSAFKAYQELNKLMIEKEQEMYIQGQIDVLFDIAMDDIEKKYHKEGKWDPQSEIEEHINFCLSHLGNFTDIEYEIWCMMACIIGIK